MERKKTVISNGKEFTLLRGFRIKGELDDRKKVAKEKGYLVLTKQIGKNEWLLYVNPKPDSLSKKKKRNRAANKK